MLLNNIMLGCFINIAQDAQYVQQHVYETVNCERYIYPLSKTSFPLASEEVKIRLKHRDWEVEITCLESKVKQVVENVLSGIDTSNASVDLNSANHIAELKREMDSLKSLISSVDIDQKQMTNTIGSIQKVPPKLGITCRGVLENLWHEGYFVAEKPL